ncbi:MAG: hypothetical protein J0L63_05040 [Anaerolineae bacterium]|nr:hypothetical protein [Anaerolineae bacterium]
MTALDRLRNRIDLVNVPFTDRGSRLLVFRRGDELSVRLAERWEKWEREVGHYRQRPPILEHLTIIAPDGQPVPFEVEAYPHLVRLQTALGAFHWLFIDPESILVTLPAGGFGFSFDVRAERGSADRRGAALHGKRNVAYTTNASIRRNELLSVGEGLFHVNLTLESSEADVLLLNITPRMGYNRSLPIAAAAIEEARSRWQAWFDAAPPVLEKYQDQYLYAWWVMRAGLLNTRYFFTREALVPSKIHYVGVWHWDQFFHAIAYRHVDARLAEDQIRIILDHQRENGMLPDAIHDEGLVTHLTKPVDADVTKPPLAAWTALKLYEKTLRIDFLEEIYEPLVRWHNWWVENSVNWNGLCEYRHPFSSGLDDSPLWDEGMPVVAPDLNTYLCLQQESLARIAELIGLPGDAVRFREGADQLASLMMTQLWDEEKGCFNALHDNQPVGCFTPFHLLPLWTGRFTQTVVDRLIAHLTNPTEFWPNWPIPTVSVSDPKFDPLQMWRGPTWVNINYLFIEALNRVGQYDLARQLRSKTLELLMQQNDIYEYYNPLDATRPPKAAPIFGWSSAVFIDLAIQETQDSQSQPAGAQLESR